MPERLFVYGSLLKGFFNYNRYLRGRVTQRELARTRGRLYHLGQHGYPALVDGPDYVYGELISVWDMKQTLTELDILENYFGENQEQNEYNREVREAEVLTDGRTELAFVYVYNPSRLQGLKTAEHIPQGDWKKYMARERGI